MLFSCFSVMLETYTKLRQGLIEKLREKGIEENILKAMIKVPRHLFLNGDVSPMEAYEDKPLGIGEGQTISQPFTVAYQTQLLDLEPGEKVLEIGTGSGYQSAVLTEMGAEVYTIERHEKLYNSTKERLKQLGYQNVHMVLGDGNSGILEFAPYDKIIITAAAPGIPQELLKQLRERGKMVLPVDGSIQRMKCVIKISEKEIYEEDRGFFHFVPMLTGIVIDEVEK